MDATLLVAGQTVVGSGERIEIRDPFTGDVVGTAPEASPDEIDRAIQAAVEATRSSIQPSAGDRAAVLERAAQLVAAERDELATLVVREQGKTINEARKEVDRVAALLKLCGGEALRIGGETVPLDQGADGVGRLGFTLRVPVGVVVAITPFNYPMLLVAHKLGPAYAAGNAVILKPATVTPLSGVRLAEILVEAGAAPGSVQCLTGAGPTVGMALCTDDRVRAVTFTGSERAGQAITARAGVKKLLMELGANCPMIVAADADLKHAAEAAAVGGFANAGQACISAQRIIVERSVYADFLQVLGAKVNAIQAGNPMSDATSMGPLISSAEARRVHEIVIEAQKTGARVVTGGDLDGSLYAPTVIADVSAKSRLYAEELFGPAVGVTPVDNLNEAIALANSSEYGLGAGIFTSSIHKAVDFVHRMEAGVLQVNWSPLWRADSMPYGGLKKSGVGKEGPRWAVEELTETKTVVIHPPPATN